MLKFLLKIIIGLALFLLIVYGIAKALHVDQIMNFFREALGKILFENFK